MTSTAVPIDTSQARARSLDAADPLASYRSRFLLPTAADGAPRVYLAGQSLGAQPIAARAAVEAELEAWARLGVDGWFAGGRSWLAADGIAREAAARIVGASPSEVATLNTLTVNLHLLMASFFRPAGARTAILIDAPTFPSDRYAVLRVATSDGRAPTMRAAASRATPSAASHERSPANQPSTPRRAQASSSASTAARAAIGWAPSD